MKPEDYQKLQVLQHDPSGPDVIYGDTGDFDVDEGRIEDRFWFKGGWALRLRRTLGRGMQLGLRYMWSMTFRERCAKS